MKIFIRYIAYTFLLAILITTCKPIKKIDIYGFWQGPHPTDINKNFYVYLQKKQDTIIAQGYWTEEKFYSSKFIIIKLLIHGDSIQFFIPQWNCTYLGKFTNNQLINGGFKCEGEDFDTVKLIRDDEVKKYLTEAKPSCNNQNYIYYHSKPNSLDNSNHSEYLLTSNDSLFIYTLVNEIIDNKYGRLNSFLLVKKGKLICEEYFYGYTKDDLHQIESSTKSITSLLVGIAKDKDYIKELDEPIYKIFSNYNHLKSGNYSKISFKNLLTMTSGFNPEYEPYRNDYNRIEYSLNRKLIEEPGKKFIYDGGNPEILGGIIKLKTGLYADEFAKVNLFQPLGISNYNWGTFKQNGFPCMGGSLELLPRDMAKIGLMVLNKGQYENKQIVSSKWIEESTSTKVKTNIGDDNYAYLWWNININSNGKKYNCIWANGLGSQFIYIFPELDVVIVTTGSNYEYDSWAISEGISKYLFLLDNN